MAIGLTDTQIEQMSPQDRRDLIRRLRVLPELRLPPPHVIARLRLVRLTLMVGGSVALIPWIVFLALTLPDNYQARNWPGTWVGFDLLLVVMMASTAYLGWRRRQLVMLPAFGSGLLLLADAWFDIMTAEPDDMWLSVLTGLGAEVPLAVLQIAGALALFRFTMLAHPLADPSVSVWRQRFQI
ncbi:hypothetical protein D5S18_27930 [Nocardia panacis]|uniref:Uncharacterized protein n=1 Tax=Nocardia panacis TaxID=2340916 RepID=A0A3A4KBY8_9NOCA|nr:hypothetical protein [Nocardia panacis]RJO71000.1 hypothetical protein D5S18_27930 [Nocardia panacis]